MQTNKALSIEIFVDGKRYELTQETFRKILNSAAFQLQRLKDANMDFTKQEAHTLEVIRTFQFHHRDLI